MKKKFGGAGRNSSTEFHLNIIPILDCLTILVTYMLAAGVYISVAVLNVGVASGAKSLDDSEPPPVAVEVKLRGNRSMLLQISGRVTKSIRIKTKNNKWDHQALAEELGGIKKRWPKVESLTLIAQKNVPYEDIVKTMDISMATHPKVSLGGF